MKHREKYWLAMLAAAVLAACSGSSSELMATRPQAGSVTPAVVTGPIGTAGLHGHPLWDSWYDLGELGYVEQEYFVAGAAQSHPAGASAPYTTRIIVRRPAEPAQFNGTVLLDWVNVTAQFENAVDTLESHELFHREGFAYVHVSAQAAGICCVPELTPKLWDPVRYAALAHPGDDYAFDMFSQVAQAIRAPAGVDPMGGLHVQRMIAMGQSQSASRLYDYVTEVQAQAGVIDGFLIHSGGGRTYDPPPAVPVIQLFSEAEVSPEPPSDVANYRAWEIAGAAHQNFWVGYHQVLGQGPRVLVDLPQQPASADEDMHQVTANYGEQIDPLQLICIVAGSQFPTRYLVSAALHHLNRWIIDGTLPPAGERFQFDGSGQLARDEFGNGLGGIRLPPIEVPAARYVSDLCVLGGITIPFTDLELQQLYPSHADYFCRMQAATQRSVDEGFLLPEDAAELMGRVEAAKNRWLAAGGRSC
jgi:hypothetical protein